jgi:hypothetical protein
VVCQQALIALAHQVVHLGLGVVLLQLIGYSRSQDGIAYESGLYNQDLLHAWG